MVERPCVRSVSSVAPVRETLAYIYLIILWVTLPLLPRLHKRPQLGVAFGVGALFSAGWTLANQLALLAIQPARAIPAAHLSAACAYLLMGRFVTPSVVHRFPAISQRIGPGFEVVERS